MSTEELSKTNLLLQRGHIGRALRNSCLELLGTYPEDPRLLAMLARLNAETKRTTFSEAEEHREGAGRRTSAARTAPRLRWRCWLFVKAGARRGSPRLRTSPPTGTPHTSTKLCRASSGLTGPLGTSRGTNTRSPSGRGRYPHRVFAPQRTKLAAESPPTRLRSP